MDTPDGTRASVSGWSGQKPECRAISNVMKRVVLMGEQGSLISGSGVSDPGKVAQKVAQNNLHAVVFATSNLGLELEQLTNDTRQVHSDSDTSSNTANPVSFCSGPSIDMPTHR